MAGMGRGFLFLFSLCAWAAMAGAQDGKPLSALPEGSFQFQGSWDCAGAFGNGKTHKSIYAGSVILGGKWLELTEQDTEPATYSSADGWQSGVLTMTSLVSQNAKAAYAVNRFVFSITARDSFTVEWQIAKTVASSWVTSDHLTCRRGAPA